MIKAKMKGTSLDAIAKANVATVQQAVDLTIENGNLPNAGQEKKVVGTAFATPVGKMSAPIEGNSGVFVVQTKAVTKAPVLPKYTDYVAKVKAQTGSYSGRVIPALKAEAKIKDNRAKFNF
jgi:peptidyl-prolyl cis-trans isomerase D